MNHYNNNPEEAHNQIMFSFMENPNVLPHTLLSLTMSIASRQPMFICYTDAQGNRTDRRIIVDSIGRCDNTNSVLVFAEDLDKNETRSFRLDRISAAVDGSTATEIINNLLS